MKTFIFLSTLIFLNIAHAEGDERKPAVEPIQEIDIEQYQNQDPSNAKGYDFSHPVAPLAKSKVKKADSPSGINIWGPIIFLLSVPVAIWLGLSKSFNEKEIASDKQHGYYRKDFQLIKKEQSNDDEDDDFDLPKAS